MFQKVAPRLCGRALFFPLEAGQGAEEEQNFAGVRAFRLRSGQESPPHEKNRKDSTGPNRQGPGHSRNFLPHAPPHVYPPPGGRKTGGRMSTKQNEANQRRSFRRMAAIISGNFEHAQLLTLAYSPGAFTLRLWTRASTAPLCTGPGAW